MLIGLREILTHLTNDSSAALKYKISVVWFRMRVLYVEADLCRKMNSSSSLGKAEMKCKPLKRVWGRFRNAVLKLSSKALDKLFFVTLILCFNEHIKW